MKFKLALLLTFAPCVFAQETRDVSFQAVTPPPVAGVAVGMSFKDSLTPVKGAPYQATVTNESVQTLADGNRIVQSSSGNTARDSQGRTRQDAVLPAIGPLAAAEAPRLIFIQDPVAEVSYTLNMADKTAQKIPMPPALPAGAPGNEAGATFYKQMGPVTAVDAAPAHSAEVLSTETAPAPPQAGTVRTMMFQKFIAEGEGQLTTEDLGTQTLEGIVVTGVRTTRTIPPGQIGNEKPIIITTEVWTSPELKTIVSSKRVDPRIGEQTFKLTNIVRTEPDPSLFVIPPDFKLTEGPQHVMYRSNR
jgi:hypothetical protein